MTEDDKKISDQLVRLVQIFFGFVLAQSLGRYDDVFLNLQNKNHFLGVFSLITIFGTTILSWIDWHSTMILRPYNFNPKNPHRIIHELRLFSDILIVVIYSYVLLTIKSFSSNPSANISSFVWGFVFIFGGYMFSGVLRRITYGALASNLSLILLFGFLYLVISLGYGYFIKRFDKNISTINYIVVLLLAISMIFYRLSRRHLRNKRENEKQLGLKIGIDLDGVLANQIAGIIPRIKRKYGIAITYDNVTAWDLALGRSSIDKEIGYSMEDQDYVLTMPLHENGRETIEILYKDNIIYIISARPASAGAWTKLWLEKNGIPIDGIQIIGENKKSLYAFDILVDDYINNINDYLKNTIGYAIMVDQPWNRNRENLLEFIQCGRLKIIRLLRELTPMVREIKRNMEYLEIN